MFSIGSVYTRKNKPNDGLYLSVGVIDKGGLQDKYLSLNHKYTLNGSKQVNSATAFICDLEQEVLDKWWKAIGGKKGTELSLLIEDASPDTCIALVALQFRLEGKKIPAAWRNYADLWEQGYTPGAEVQVNYGSYISAFSHSLIQLNDADHVADLTVYNEILPACISYTRTLIEQGILPTAMNKWIDGLDPVSLQTHKDAYAALADEISAYRHMIESSQKIQLAVPIANSNRKSLVDCLILVEAKITGITMRLARADTNSATGYGYSIIALHRPNPSLAGSGNDMSVSIDPHRNLDISDLWCCLERDEERKWHDFSLEEDGFARPRDGIDGNNSELNRQNLPIYQYAGRDSQPCHQPWYDGGAVTCTLVAAPRFVWVDGEKYLGSKLSWHDVKDAMWSCFAPTMGLRVLGDDDTFLGGRKLTNNTQIEPMIKMLDVAAGLRIIKGHRVHHSNEVFSVWSPTLYASCASLLDNGATSISTLTPSSDYEVLNDRGGVALIAKQGIMLLDLTKDGIFPIAMLEDAAKEIASVLAGALDAENKISRDTNSVRAKTIKAISTGDEKSKREALVSIYQVRLAARKAFQKSRIDHGDFFVRRFKSLCSEKWLANQRMQNVLEELDELERMLVSVSEVRASSMLDRIAVFGLPLSIASGVLGSIIAIDNHQDFIGFSEPIFWAFVGISGLFTAIIFLWLLYIRRQWKITDN